MTLRVNGDDVAATSDIKLGNVSIGPDGSWAGVWDSLPPRADNGSFSVEIPPASAVLIRLSP
jgi:hypothetical protein